MNERDRQRGVVSKPLIVAQIITWASIVVVPLLCMIIVHGG